MDFESSGEMEELISIRHSASHKVNPQRIVDQINGDTIILNGEGKFPKKLIIINEYGEKREYRIVKTKKGGFILNI